MKTTHFFKAGMLVLVLASAVAFKGEKDRLHKRDFTVMVTEGKKPKAVADEFSFKDGKVYCGDVLADKYPDIGWLRYEMKVDSSYMDEDIEKEYIEVIATKDLDKGESFEMKCTIDDFNIEGSMRVFKGEKDKKTFTFTGKEKPKKEKKKKGKEEEQ